MNFFKKTLASISLLGILLIPSISSAVTFYKPFMESSRGESMKATVPIGFDDRLNESIDSLYIEVASKASYELANIPYNADVSDIKFNLTIGQDGFPYILATSKSVMTSNAYRVLVRIHNKITGAVVYQDFNLGVFPNVKKTTKVMSIPHSAFNKINSISQIKKSKPRLRIKREKVKPVVISIRKMNVRVNPVSPVLSKVVPSSSVYDKRLPSTYKVRRGDVLTSIAKKLSKGSAYWNMWSMTGALYEGNKDSFTNGNINLLKRNSILKLPSNSMVSKYKKYTKAYSMVKISNDADLLKKVMVVKKDINNESLDPVDHVSKQEKPMPAVEFQKKALSSIENVLLQAKQRSHDLDSLHDIIKKQIDKIDALENRAKKLQSTIDKMISSRTLNNNEYDASSLSISNPQIQIAILILINIILTIMVLVLLMKRNNNKIPNGMNPASGVDTAPRRAVDKKTDVGSVRKDTSSDSDTIALKDESSLLDDDFFEDDEGYDIVRLPVYLDRKSPSIDSLSLNNEVSSVGDNIKADSNKKEKVTIKKLIIPPFFKTGVDSSSPESKDGIIMSNDEAEEKIKKAYNLIMNNNNLNEDDYSSVKVIIKDLLSWSPSAFRVMSLKVEMYSKKDMKIEMLKYMGNIRLDLSDSKWDIFLSMLSKDIVDDYNSNSI